jgi:hypothetical protein
MQASDEEIFSIMLNGQAVECGSLEDAVAVKTAADILHGDDPTPYLPVQLERLAAVLVRYGQRRTAAMLITRNGQS